jgi:hypothetical protein
MTFTYDLSTDVGKLRLLIGDTVEDAGALPQGRNFGDHELTFFLTEADNDLKLAEASATEVLAASWSKVADTTMGPLKESLSDVAKAFERRAQVLRAQYGGTPTAFSVGFMRDDAYANQE